MEHNWFITGVTDLQTYFALGWGDFEKKSPFFFYIEPASCVTQTKFLIHSETFFKGSLTRHGLNIRRWNVWFTEKKSFNFSFELFHFDLQDLSLRNRYKFNGIISWCHNVAPYPTTSSTLGTFHTKKCVLKGKKWPK